MTGDLDRRVHKAVRALRHACAQLRHRADVDNPLALIAEPPTIADLAQRDNPTAKALAEWLAVLELERRCWRDRVAFERAWRTGDPSQAALLRALLMARRLPARERAARDFGDRAAALHDAAMQHYVRRFESDELLREQLAALPTTTVVHAGSVTSSNAAPPLWQRVSGGAVAVDELAAALLERTHGVAEECLSESWWVSLRLALGTEAGEGWPARLAPDWFASVFRRAPISDGLRLDLAGLPTAGGASSFARALALFGAALQDASRPRALPFALHTQPFGTARHRTGALLGGLIGERVFHKRVLGLGEDRVVDQRRAIARAFVASLRNDALAVRLSLTLSQSRRAAEELWPELTERTWGAAAPGWMLGVVPRFRPATASALVGRIAAVADRDEVVERFDEDWFQNPRAIEWLRERMAQGERPVAMKRLLGNVDRIGQLIEQAVG